MGIRFRDIIRANGRRDLRREARDPVTADPQSVALTRINDDSSWLVELDGTRILLDPWFGGDAVLIGLRAVSWARLERPVLPREQVGAVDAVLISHPFPDHLHRASLRTVAPETPAFGPAQVAPWIRLLGGFRAVTTIGNTTRGADPTVVGNVRIHHCRAQGALDTTHNGLVLQGVRSGTSLLYCPHGMLLGDRTMDAVERVVGGRLDILLCSFTLLDLPWWLGGVANLGREAGVALARHLGPRFVFNTHDGTKSDGGLVGAVSRFERCPHADEALATAGLEFHAPRLEVGQRWSPAGVSV